MPQELTTDMFETVRATVNYSRELFGRPRDAALIERLLRDLALWDKRDARIMTLSGGMKRRLMIAKALSHEPRILFLDEPSAGVDVELRRAMWEQVRALRDSGVTIILTTHYIEEAEEMADRIGVINHGELILVENKATLMRQLGRRQLTLQLLEPMHVPARAAGLAAGARGRWDRAALQLRGRRGAHRHTGAAAPARRARHRLQGLHTHQSSLEEIFVAPGERTPPRCSVTPPYFNRRGVWAIYKFEMARFGRTVWQSIVAPVLSTSLYFVVFGAAIGGRMSQVGGVSYGAFIVPG